MVWNCEGVQLQGLLLRGLVTVVIKSWPSCTDILGMKGKDGRRSWITSCGWRRTSDETKIHNLFKTWDSWDHYPIYAVIQENEASNYLPERREKENMDGMEATK